MQALLLAAGYGTRLRPYTDIRPKPLFPVVNRPLLEILIESLQAAGCRRIIVNCHHLHDQVEKAVSGYQEVLVQVEPEILGTGGSIAKASEQLDREPLLVVNGDIYHDIDLGELYSQHLQLGLPVTMAMHDYPRFNGVCTADGLVKGFKPKEDDIRRAFTGVHVLNPEIVDLIPKEGFFHIIDLYAGLAEQGKIAEASVDGCFWRDIGTLEDYLQLHGQLLGNNPRWEIHPSASIGQGVVLEDWGVIGAGCRIENSVRLQRTVVWENVRIEEGRACSDCILTGTELDHGG